jgi:hypothetical protein
MLFLRTAYFFQTTQRKRRHVQIAKLSMQSTVTIEIIDTYWYVPVRNHRILPLYCNISLYRCKFPILLLLMNMTALESVKRKCLGIPHIISIFPTTSTDPPHCGSLGNDS